MTSATGKRRRQLLKAQQKKAAKKAIKKESQFIKTLPQISENDLLAFQFAHFGDDSKPEKWFVTPEDAINFEPEYEDTLGYYDDGVKRTLTDEEIAVFRRTEMWNLEREQLKLAAEAEESREGAAESERFEEGQDPVDDLQDGARSPVSDVSSLEDELISYAARSKMQQPGADTPQVNMGRRRSIPRDPSQSRGSPPRQSSHSQSRKSVPRETSQGRRSETPISNDGTKRRRSQEVPYEERRKRHWESYIEENDPVEGSITHRRMARELDNQKEETFEMDY